MYEGRLVGMQVDWHARIFIASFELAEGQLQKLVFIRIENLPRNSSMFVGNLGK